MLCNNLGITRGLYYTLITRIEKLFYYKYNTTQQKRLYDKRFGGNCLWTLVSINLLYCVTIKQG